MNPIVSIIIPFYNAEKYLAATINSAIAQTWKHKEIILVDDGSTDKSFQLAQEFRCDEIKILSQKNRGAAAARNLGLLEARGNYVQFLDADDLLSPDKIEKQVLALQNEQDKLAVCSTVHFPDDQNHLLFVPSAFEEAFIYDTNDPIHFIIKLWGGYDHNACMIQPNAWLTPISLIQAVGKWNEDLSTDDDGEYFTRILLHSRGIVRVTGVFNYYRKQSNQKSLSANKSLKNLLSQLKSTLIKKKELLSKENTIEAKQAIHRQLFEIILKTYPQYPSIYKIALNELPKVDNVYYKPILGGSIIQKIIGIFGWKTARILQYILTQK